MCARAHWSVAITGIILQSIADSYKAGKAKEKEKEYIALSPEGILNADKSNYAIPNSEITKVELSYNLKPRFGKPRPREIEITTGVTKRKWNIREDVPDVVPGEDDPAPRRVLFEVRWRKKGTSLSLEEYEYMLRPIFGDKFSTTDQPIEEKPGRIRTSMRRALVTLLAFAVWLGLIIFVGLSELQSTGWIGFDWFMFSLLWTIFIGLPMSMIYGWLVGRRLSNRLLRSMLVWICVHFIMFFLDLTMDLQWLPLVVPIVCSLFFYAIWGKLKE